jgi:periplasmic divalent cation tolerance protein
MPEPLVQVLTTVESREQALELAHAVIEARSAACVQIVGPITSVYRWQGRVEETAEYLLLMKVPAEGAEGLAGFVRRRHPYHTPELTAVPSSFVDQRYLAWVEEVTAPARK